VSRLESLDRRLHHPKDTAVQIEVDGRGRLGYRASVVTTQ
jgi:hypothetical protein